ncbi:two-component sensor histidine kinase [Porphyrobacter algicida]|uniref:histidine kinase n=1 Tax=Qipengyuania algicida TaxID=1836209 RepID=A0A845AHL5_9SPHN|nr:ATP-binding protein [Qipengyuania algicida]MXP28947.1 two-component sensor histidine kinase [Qipengyuania algicida]
MEPEPLRWVGIILAIGAIVALLHAVGTPVFVIVLVGLIWILTLWLARSQPEQIVVRRPAEFTIDRLSELFEDSETPVLITRHNRVIFANASARNLFGTHLLEQDARMALRHPEAVRLIESKKSGNAFVTGLVRRRDVWAINRKALQDDMGILEFINRTSEADISRAHTDFVANASHELRTPLASIIGYVETLQEDGGSLDTKIATRFLDTILREAQRLQSLVSDLMSLSRIEAEKHDLPEDRIALGPLVERATRDAAGVDGVERLTIAIEGDASVRGDTQQIEQLVRNLVDNALKYGASGGPVTVKLQVQKPGRARLTVSDSGDGIPAEHIPHLTRRFYRTDPGRSRASGGTGLGLAIVKHIVERHRGRLSIDSTPGHGTSVHVTLPTDL